ncbi:MAG: S1C family serine protease [Candidatus Limnocylindria bacterium]
MSDTPTGSDAPPARQAGPSRGGMLIAGVLIGAMVGGVAGGLVSRSGALPPASGPPFTGLPTAPPVTGAQDADRVVQVVRDVGPAVVTVLNRLPGGQVQSTGSGFVIDAGLGYVATNSHVVSNVRGGGAGAAFDIIFADGSTSGATLVGRDPQSDVAVLRVERRDLVAAALGDSDEVPIGAEVVAIGSALGELQNSVTTGVVSGKGRRFASELDPTIFFEDLVQTDAAISPGNSGGPLIWAATKQVIGMNTLVRREPGSEGLGFAVSSNTVRQIAEELIRSGRVERGFIGIGYQPLTPRAIQILGLPPETSGVVVNEIIPGSPATQAGLRPGDVVTKVNEQQIDTEHPLIGIMLRFRAGDRVRLTVVRDGREQTVEVTLGQQPSP